MDINKVKDRGTFNIGWARRKQFGEVRLAVTSNQYPEPNLQIMECD